MHNQPDYIDLSLMAVMCITVVVWLVLEARHNDSFRKDATPMPRHTRNVLMWIALFEIAAITFWETQHGTFVF
jgi:uncharacterized membrane protein